MKYFWIMLVTDMITTMTPAIQEKQVIIFHPLMHILCSRKKIQANFTDFQGVSLQSGHLVLIGIRTWIEIYFRVADSVTSVRISLLVPN